MREPWDLAQQFISGMQQQAANSRATADSALMRMFAANIGRGDAATQQGYSMDTLAKRNDYSTQADTIAYDRQTQRDNSAFQHQDARDLTNRGYTVADNAQNFDQRQQLTDQEQQWQLEREKEAYNGYGNSKARRFGAFNSGDAYIDTTVGRESNGKADAKNPLSSARGYGQFTDGTWAGMMRSHPELGLTPDGRSDAEQSKRALIAFTNDNARVLQGNGIEPTPGNKYAAHFLGAGGAVRALRSPDNAPMSAVVDPATLKANPFLGGMNVAQFKQWTASKYQGQANGTVGTDTGTSQRRYGPPQQQQDYGDQVLGAPVGNSTSQQMSQDSGPAPVSPWMQKYLDDNGLQAKERVTMTEAQLALLPQELQKAFIPDIADTTSQGAKGAKTEYIMVEPRAADPTKMGVAPGKPAKTEATPIDTKPAQRGRYVDGKFIMQDGTNIALPD